jgi:hypothetical protein
VSKALYILGYQKNVEYGRITKLDGQISVEAETYDEAVEKAIRRLPASVGEKTKTEYIGYGYANPRESKHDYQHAFRLIECFDQQHANYIPQSQEINVNNSSHSSSFSAAVSRSSLL